MEEIVDVLPPDHEEVSDEPENDGPETESEFLARALPEWGPGWPNCQSNMQALVTTKRGLRVTVRREISELVGLLLDETENMGYDVRQNDTGGYVCRPIGGTRTASNHSWGLAIDINWGTNGFGYNVPHDIPSAVAQMWKNYGFSWGGDWSGKKDWMHFEWKRGKLDAIRFTNLFKKDHPTSTTPTIPPQQPPTTNKCGDPAGHPLLKRGAKGPAVNHLQYLLIRTGSKISGDGDFGQATESALRNFQTWAKISSDGVCGPNTWATLHKYVDGLTI